MFLFAINDVIEIGISDILDILFVAILIYGLYELIKGTVAVRIFIGIFAVYLIWKLVGVFEMRMFNEILGQFISVGVIAVIIVFQQETRKFLLMLGSAGFLRNSKLYRGLRLKYASKVEVDYKPIVEVCKEFSKKKTGCIIIITRRNDLDEIIETGEKIDGILSASLLETIFFKNNPLHDGAVVIKDNKIKAAACILPITKRIDIPARYGLRHRAAIGLTEMTDAIAVIVSEETGNISLVEYGNLRNDVSPVELSNFFINLTL